MSILSTDIESVTTSIGMLVESFRIMQILYSQFHTEVIK